MSILLFNIEITVTWLPPAFIVASMVKGQDNIPCLFSGFPITLPHWMSIYKHTLVFLVFFCLVLFCFFVLSHIQDAVRKVLLFLSPSTMTVHSSYKQWNGLGTFIGPDQLEPTFWNIFTCPESNGKHLNQFRAMNKHRGREVGDCPLHTLNHGHEGDSLRTSVWKMLGEVKQLHFKTPCC